MSDQDKVKMKINIAGEQIILSVPFDRQVAARNAEKSVNSLFNTWRKRFPGKSEKELMAMIAFQYASHYGDLSEIIGEADRISAALSNRVDDAIGDAPVKQRAKPDYGSIDSEDFIPTLPN